ncbi:hypothetical protein OC25_03155 [Pedobacter kyungheensis]|uniref:Uncharacterized protein n=1 Tax=Pedobacter kyungheensis TaxID=1069985 RepID=A0A0C1FY30_9SPHI|nr:hypothetical protein [Pedobacter kyungheensis]KIA96728.1 hypothetical protein OC25_03155 [Pedobacter kyungheensis]
MKKHFLIYSLLCLVYVNLYAQKKREITHYNLIIVPDLSNRLDSRLYPKAVDDVDIVQGIFNNIWPYFLRLNRDDGQLDHYSIDFINKGLIGLYKINTDVLTIDFQRFDRQSERINYILGRNNVSRTLPKDIINLISEYKRFNNKSIVAKNGADIWTYFQSGIDDRVILPDIKNGKIVHKFRNIMILLTDGYIEAGIYNKGYDLSSSKVTAFRDAFLKSKGADMSFFLSKNPKFKINPVKNPFLKNLEVIVLEMYDRSLSKAGVATKHPTDMEIMKLIWTDWLKNSGLKRFELKAIASNKQEANKYIVDFIKKSN